MFTRTHKTARPRRPDGRRTAGRAIEFTGVITVAPTVQKIGAVGDLLGRGGGCIDFPGDRRGIRGVDALNELSTELGPPKTEAPPPFARTSSAISFRSTTTLHRFPSLCTASLTVPRSRPWVVPRTRLLRSLAPVDKDAIGTDRIPRIPVILAARRIPLPIRVRNQGLDGRARMHLPSPGERSPAAVSQPVGDSPLDSRWQIDTESSTAPAVPPIWSWHRRIRQDFLFASAWLGYYPSLVRATPFEFGVALPSVEFTKLNRSAILESKETQPEFGGLPNYGFHSLIFEAGIRPRSWYRVVGFNRGFHCNDQYSYKQAGCQARTGILVAAWLNFVGNFMLRAVPSYFALSLVRFIANSTLSSATQIYPARLDVIKPPKWTRHSTQPASASIGSVSALYVHLRLPSGSPLFTRPPTDIRASPSIPVLLHDAFNPALPRPVPTRDFRSHPHSSSPFPRSLAGIHTTFGTQHLGFAEGGPRRAEPNMASETVRLLGNPATGWWSRRRPGGPGDGIRTYSKARVAPASAEIFHSPYCEIRKNEDVNVRLNLRTRGDGLTLTLSSRRAYGRKIDIAWFEKSLPHAWIRVPANRRDGGRLDSKIREIKILGSPARRGQGWVEVSSELAKACRNPARSSLLTHLLVFHSTTGALPPWACKNEIKRSIGVGNTRTQKRRSRAHGHHCQNPSLKFFLSVAVQKGADRPYRV
ncbi:hypothetical protein B0H10DRAFT_1939481 [Mycena sp. CBHHK59/15]|nr:hypothetical protein B0H10DRAFT_1939481 [Mycena sp. CBHHK59/15]